MYELLNRDFLHYVVESTNTLVKITTYVLSKRHSIVKKIDRPLGSFEFIVRTQAEGVKKGRKLACALCTV